MTSKKFELSKRKTLNIKLKSCKQVHVLLIFTCLFYYLITVDYVRIFVFFITACAVNRLILSSAKMSSSLTSC